MDNIPENEYLRPRSPLHSPLSRSRTLDRKVAKHEMAVEDREQEHRIEIENQQTDNTYKSCCIEMDKRFLQFLSQFVIGFFIIIFCSVQLVRLDKAEDQRTYISLLSLIIGIFLPSPSIKK